MAAGWEGARHAGEASAAIAFEAPSLQVLPITDAVLRSLDGPPPAVAGARAAPDTTQPVPKVKPRPRALRLLSACTGENSTAYVEVQDFLRANAAYVEVPAAELGLRGEAAPAAAELGLRGEAEPASVVTGANIRITGAQAATVVAAQPAPKRRRLTYTGKDLQRECLRRSVGAKIKMAEMHDDIEALQANLYLEFMERRVQMRQMQEKIDFLTELVALKGKAIKILQESLDLSEEYRRDKRGGDDEQEVRRNDVLESRPPRES